MHLPVLSSLTTLGHHLHTLVGSALFWQLVFWVSGVVSNTHVEEYRKMSKQKKVDWQTHCVSMVHALLISTLAFPIVFSTNSLLREDRVFGYDPYAANVHAVACGYFLWDALVCLYYYHGWEFVMHGVVSFLVFFFSFTPILNYYGATFLLFELSTPFLNLHYFLDKSSLSGSRLHVINGLTLLATFFAARLVFGFYMGFYFLSDLIAEHQRIPTHLLTLYGLALFGMTSLNVFWFKKMINMASRKLLNPKKVAHKTQ